MKTQKITLSGAFHNVSNINLRLTKNELSEGQYKRLAAHMCGVENCICGWRGYDLEGIERAIFSEMLINASYKMYLRGNP